MTALNVVVRGPLFDRRIDNVIKDAIVQEVMSKVDERVKRRGRTLGRQRNTISTSGEMELIIDTTKVWPRTRGTAWQRKNVAIIRAMAPRVIRSTARRIVGELGG